jgi:hypothetical protein
MQYHASVHGLDAEPSALSRISIRFGGFPAIVFALLSLAFGSAIIVVNPPLRGPDEISHFLRIHSYSRGEFLPTTEIDGRKGIFVERKLHDRLYFFKDPGEWFARSREEGVRYGPIMAEYRRFGGCRLGSSQARLQSGSTPSPPPPDRFVSFMLDCEKRHWPKMPGFRFIGERSVCSG